MKSTQYRAAIERLGLSQHGAADLLGVARRTSQHWALGEYRVPEPVAILLRLLLKGRITIEDVEDVK